MEPFARVKSHLRKQPRSESDRSRVSVPTQQKPFFYRPHTGVDGSLFDEFRIRRRTIMVEAAVRRVKGMGGDAPVG